MRTNIFKMLNLETKENFHSAFIAAIFNSCEFAREEFIKILNKPLDENTILQFDHKNLKAQTEKVLSNDKSARVDIYLTDYMDEDNKGNTRIIIENKIYAKDQYYQLDKYYNHLQKGEYENHGLFYLTLENKNASSSSAQKLQKHKDYYLLNYSDHIKKWLLSILAQPELDSNLLVYVKDYLIILEELTICYNMLENGFDENKCNDKATFDALLELKLWQELETQITTKFGSQIEINTHFRYYSYSKALMSSKKKRDMPRDYGLVLHNTTNDNFKYIRISVNPRTNQLSIRQGNIIDGKWDHKSEKVMDNNMADLSDLKKIEDIYMLIDKIMSQLQNSI